MENEIKFEDLRELYFSENIQNWINNFFLKHQNYSEKTIINKLTDKGIALSIASSLVGKWFNGFTMKKGVSPIPYDELEPQDDRDFSSSQMYDFAYKIAQEFAASIIEGGKSINGLTLEQHIAVELADMDGSGGSDNWISPTEWPKETDFTE